MMSQMAVKDLAAFEKEKKNQIKKRR